MTADARPPGAPPHSDPVSASPVIALRRLGKPVWMLNYNGEAHGLRKEVNRKDWTIRMQQFFDHYLLDAAPPVWLEEGVPATEKGRIGLAISPHRADVVGAQHPVEAALVAEA